MRTHPCTDISHPISTSKPPVDPSRAPPPADHEPQHCCASTFSLVPPTPAMIGTRVASCVNADLEEVRERGGGEWRDRQSRRCPKDHDNDNDTHTRASRQEAPRSM
ncbi:hypothetical protein K439DRAFT_1640972, partial [Ramaria rubella]